MNMKTRFVLKSRNKKTGPIPVTTTERKSCPDSCPLKKNGCYADGGPLAFRWNEVSTMGKPWKELCNDIAGLRPGQLWRHNQSGDLPHKNGVIDLKAVKSLVKANKGRRGFTYTHHDMKISANRKAVKHCNENGFTVNLSANNLSEADALDKLGIGPIAVLLSENSTDSVTPGGVPIVLCPVTTGRTESCESCRGLCARKRKTIVGFRAHGNTKRRANIIASGENHDSK